MRRHSVSCILGSHPRLASFTPDGIALALRDTAPALRQAAPAMLLGVLALAAPPAWAVDVPFAEHVISVTADAALSVHAADVDGDGDLDVLSASRLDDKIAWYENDGSQSFTLRTISVTAVDARSVDAADVDGDGDIDVLSASLDDDKIAWYENDGSQSFTLHTISLTANAALWVLPADMDGDGDVDVLSASYADDKIAWYENDGSQAFTLHTISATANEPQSVHAADLDGDGDVDALSASASSDTVYWYENDGSQSFTRRTITVTADGALVVRTADVDGDGDVDALSASLFDDKIAWYENDGSQSFTLRTISVTADFVASVDAADVDGDGDVDVLSASIDDDKVAWYDNDGSQSFTLRTISVAADGAIEALAADVDGDGDLDVLSASRDDDKIAWYENLTCTPGTLQFRAAAMVSSEVDGRRAVIVDRTGGSCGAVGVDYASTGGTATPGLHADYRNNVGGTLSFGDGDTARHFNIRVLDDALDEPNETVNLQLQNPTGGATLGTAVAVLGIRDDDAPPVVSISGPASVTEGSDLVFTLTLDAPSGRDVEVNLGLAGTAQRAIDFGFQAARVIIPAGTTVVTRDLKAGATDVYSDGLGDGGETIILSVAGATNATVSLTQDSVTVTVNDPL